MLRFLLRKFLRVITVLLGVTLITFLLMHAIPGNPWSNYSSSPRMMLGLSIDKPLQRELNRRFGLDLPLWRQFTRYVIGDFDQEGRFFCGAVCGNLGPSIQQRGRRSALSYNPLMLVIPSLCLLLISMSFILLGDFLNEATR